MTAPKIMTPGDLMKPTDTKGKPLGFEFENLTEMPPAQAVTMMYYGGSGVGKTMFVGSAGPRTLIVNIGDGIETIKSRFAKEHFYKDGSPIVTTIHEERDPTTGMFKAADAYDKVCDVIDYGLAHLADRFDTIAVDDATQMRAFAMNKGLEANQAFDRSKTLEKGRKMGAFVAAVQDYGAEMDLVEQFVAGTISLCKDHGKHFILTAHERHIFKKIRDNTGRVSGEEIDKIRPGFTGKTFPDDITNYFDLVWRAEAVRAGGKTMYRAQTEDAMSVKAKSRYPGVFKHVEDNPNFLNIISRIKAAA